MYIRILWILYTDHRFELTHVTNIMLETKIDDSFRILSIREQFTRSRENFHPEKSFFSIFPRSHNLEEEK